MDELLYCHSCDTEWVEEECDYKCINDHDVIVCPECGNILVWVD